MTTLNGMTYTYPAPPPVRPKKKSRVWLVILAIVVVLVVGCGIIAFAVTSAGVKAVDQAASAAAGGSQGIGNGPATKEPLPAGQVGEGRLEVGKDIQPGTYKATVPTDSSGCYWARLKNLDGEATSILANGISQPGSKVTVTVKATDKGFETQGCGNWTKSA